ncbi:Protein HGH1 [Dirofilaria immitis]
MEDDTQKIYAMGIKNESDRDILYCYNSLFYMLCSVSHIKSIVMKEHEISPKLIKELVHFLSPNTRRDLRQQVLDYITGLSASNQFGVIFQANDFFLGRSLCRLICEDNTNENDIFPALINATAADVVCAEHIINNIELIQRCIEYCRDDNEQYSLNAAKLLSNLSLRFPDRLYDALMKDWKNIVADIIEKLNDSTSYGNIGYLGYILVNLTSIANIRCILCEKFIRQLLPLVDCNTRSERCLIAIDILRNLCFESRFHSILLDENDEFLSTLLKPIADVNDNLNDNEIEKLPLQLQYYEGHRSEDPVIIDKIIESLYQLCRSEIGLKTLRIKGVYALLREFDRASLPSILILRNNCIPSFNENNITDDHSQSEMHDQQDLQVGSEGAELQVVKFLGETENIIYIDGENCSTLRALIGLLIQD